MGGGVERFDGVAEVPEARSRESASPASGARDLMLALLAIAAGCVDAVGYLGLGKVLTAAMTGNTVLVGLALGQADAQATLRAGVALAGFVAGALLGAAIVERGARAAAMRLRRRQPSA